MIYRPLKRKHFSRYGMGGVFLVCGLLLATVHILAGGVFLIFAAVVFYYAPRWNLRIEIKACQMYFSENVVEMEPVTITFTEIAEIRRLEEKELRKGLLATYPSFYPYIEFEMKSGKTYRMHDIFDKDLDEAILHGVGTSEVKMEAFPRVFKGSEHNITLDPACPIPPQ